MAEIGTVDLGIVYCPVFVPFPPAANQGAIYENQAAFKKLHFGRTSASAHRQTA